jgi:hypothetical protein
MLAVLKMIFGQPGEPFPLSSILKKHNTENNSIKNGQTNKAQNKNKLERGKGCANILVSMLSRH